MGQNDKWMGQNDKWMRQNDKWMGQKMGQNDNEIASTLNSIKVLFTALTMTQTEQTDVCRLNLTVHNYISIHIT